METGFKNLRTNWYLPLSAFAYLLVSVTTDTNLGMIVAIVSWILLAMTIGDLREQTTLNKPYKKVLALLSAIGALNGGRIYYSESKIRLFLDERSSSLSLLIEGLIMAFSLLFLYLLVSFVWIKLEQMIVRTGLFSDVTRNEFVFYLLTMIVIVLSMGYVYARTNLCYGAKFDWDLLYSSDSNELFKTNVWATLCNPENDIRQPIFAVAAIPFCDLPYLITEIPGFPITIKAILVNSIQISILVFTNFVVAKMLSTNRLYRVLTVISLSACFSSLLFSVMIEQYIIVYFYLILCIYWRKSQRKHSDLLLCAVSGTLITGAILMPILNEINPIYEFKKWFISVFKSAVRFFVCILLFARIDVIILDIMLSQYYLGYCGQSISMVDKLKQFTVMIESVFFSPAGRIVEGNNFTWQLSNNFHFSWIGIVLAVLSLVGLILTRQEFISRISAAWVGLSFLVTVIIGWGTAENGLILYTLYFGWAYFVLIYQLFSAILKRINKPIVTRMVFCIIIALLLIVNVTGIMEIVQFGINYYPNR